MIVKSGDKYTLKSKDGSKNLGTYDTKAGALKRERQVQYFKNKDKDIGGALKRTARRGNGMRDREQYT